MFLCRRCPRDLAAFTTNDCLRVMDKVEEKDRCTCTPKVEKNGVEYPPMGKTAD